MGVGRREALGVRQLAAVFFLCANNVPGTLFASPLMHSARQGRRALPGMLGFMHGRARCPRRAGIRTKCLALYLLVLIAQGTTDFATASVKDCERLGFERVWAPSCSI
ncbi:MAG: hypothetical protein GX456_13515 [Verrucomicrobia bacterium]|nr:hypothetical protein [Verrucomicrobiota bacterium]